eukprot:g2050.t1
MERKHAGTCYVGHVHSSVTEADLFILFSQIGAVQSVRIVLDPFTKEPRGYAYVNFFLDGEGNPVEEAISLLNYTELKGRQITVMLPEKDLEKRRRGEGNIFGLEPEIDSQTLHDTFDIFGPVASAKVAQGADGKSLGYGYVQFIHSEAADEAVARANGMMLKGRMVCVEAFKPKHERRKQTYTNLFVKNFPPSIQKKEHLVDLFSKFGKITSSFLPLKEDGGVKGFGFVNFDDPSCAKTAVNEMHDKELDGVMLYVQRAQTKAERRKLLEDKHREQRRQREKEYKGRNLYIKNFPKETTDDELFNLFSPFGTIQSAKVMMENGRSKGFGFVCFSTVKEASTALNAMNGLVVGKKALYVNIAQSREERRRILRRLRNAVSFHTASFSGQPYFYSHALPVSPVSVMSQTAQSLEQSSMSQIFTPYASMPFPLPMMVPPALVNTPNKSASEKNKSGLCGKWGEEAKDLNVENSKDSGDAPYSAIPSQLSWELYTRVSEKQTDERIAQKVTGMLLDLGTQETENMINDDALLSQRIEDSILVLRNAGMMHELSEPQNIEGQSGVKQAIKD